MFKRLLGLSVVLSLLINTSVHAMPAEKNSYPYKTEFDGVFMNEKGEYAISFENGHFFLPVGRIDVNLRDEKSLNDFMNRSTVEYETKKSVAEMAENVRSLSKEETVIATVFSSDLLTALSSTTQYNTYNGVPMKADRTYYMAISTGFQEIVSGVNTKYYAAVIGQISLLIGGIVSTGIGFGGSLLSVFEAINSTVTETSPSDFIQLALRYNGVTQQTYANDGTNWVLLDTCRRTTILNYRTYIQLVVDHVGTIMDESEDIIIILEPSDFDSPWAGCYVTLNNHLSAVNRINKWRVHNRTFVFAH